MIIRWILSRGRTFLNEHVENMRYRAHMKVARSTRLNMIIEEINGRNKDGKGLTVEIKLVKKDGRDLYVLYSQSVHAITIYAGNTSLLQWIENQSITNEADDNIRSEAIEYYSLIEGEESTYGGVLQSEYYKIYDLGAYIWSRWEWIIRYGLKCCFAAIGRPFIGRNMDEIEYMGTLDDHLYSYEYEDYDDFDEWEE